MTNRPISEMHFPGPISVPFSSSVSSAVSFHSAAFSGSPLATRHSPLTPIIPAPLATPALRVVPAPIVATTSRIHVGAPTIWSAAACRRFCDRRKSALPMVWQERITLEKREQAPALQGGNAARLGTRPLLPRGGRGIPRAARDDGRRRKESPRSSGPSRLRVSLNVRPHKGREAARGLP